MFSSDLASLYLQSNSIIIAGVSGGPDSLAMTYFLHQLGYPLVIASFNHRLRPDADADIRFVETIAKKLGLPFVTSSADVALQAVSRKLSTEEAARELRYQFLFSEARKYNAQAVVVGHTADDQAETVLMHFLRGSGLSGLKGIQPKVTLPVFDPHIPLIRPLLLWTRKETEDYCKQHHLEPRIDQTNTDIKYFRNRLRYELLPALEQYNPQIRQTLSKTAQALQGDYLLLNELLDEEWQKCLTKQGEGFIQFNREKLFSLNPSIQRNIIRKAAFLLKPGLRDIDFDVIHRAISTLPANLVGGLKTYIEANDFYITQDIDCLPDDDWPQTQTEFDLLPGHNTLNHAWKIILEEYHRDSDSLHHAKSSDHFTALLDANLTTQLSVRTYRTGDRFEPLGMPHQSIRLQDLFVNLKIPKRLRKRWPVVCSGEKIVWIPGLRFAETFKVTEQTRCIIKLQVAKK